MQTSTARATAWIKVASAGNLAALREIASRHPGAALLTAAVLGFVLGRSLARH